MLLLWYHVVVLGEYLEFLGNLLTYALLWENNFLKYLFLCVLICFSLLEFQGGNL